MNFFSLLKKKITPESSKLLDRNFDQRFWNRFEAEFGNSTNNKISPIALFWKKLSMRFVLTSLATLSIVITVMFSQHQKRELELDILKHEQLVDHLDLFMTFDDVSTLTDADWKELLNDSTLKQIDQTDSEDDENDESET